MANEVMNFMLNSGFFNVGFYIVLVLIVMGLIGWGIWWWIKKKTIFVYNFRLIDNTGKLIKKKARIIRSHNGVMKFQFDDIKNQLLDVRDPNCIVDGVSTRVISWDGMGNLIYTENIDYPNLNSNHRFKVAKEEYLKTALRPVEREQVANGIIDSIKKHGDTPSALKMAFWFAIALLIVIVIGMFIQGRLLSEQYVQNSKAIETQHETAEALKDTANIIKENTEVQKIVLQYVMGDKYNLTFTANFTSTK